MTREENYNELAKLIEEYIQCAKYSCALLKQLHNGEETFLRAKVLKLIPKEGFIENVFYKFHGSGCYFEYPNNHIDLDFGPNNRCDGFDLFRLKDFFSGITDKGKYKALMENNGFEQQFEELVKAKIICNPKSEPSPHLYYFASVSPSM